MPGVGSCLLSFSSGSPRSGRLLSNPPMWKWRSRGKGPLPEDSNGFWMSSLTCVASSHRALNQEWELF